MQKSQRRKGTWNMIIWAALKASEESRYDNISSLKISTGHQTRSDKQKIELYLTIAASQWAQLSDMKLICL